jgi:predicted RNase H-like HicB family nuclease
MRTLAGFPERNRTVVQSSPEGYGLITFKVETEREDDGRWLAEVLELPGVLAYGESEDAALSKVQALALRVIAERLEHGEAGPELLTISFNAA